VVSVIVNYLTLDLLLPMMRGELGPAMGGEVSDIKRRVGRFFLSVVVAYAVAVQSLLIAIGGFSQPADAGLNGPAFTLCLHDSSGTEKLPASDPNQSGCTHCIFCFAGAHHALAGAAPVFFGRVALTAVIVPWLGHERNGVRIVRHTIAIPRGPPVVA
jgi:hypothetical protein